MIALRLGDLPALPVLGDGRPLAISLSAAASSAAVLFTGRPRGLPDWPFLKAGVQWRLAVVRCAFALGLGHLALWGVSASISGVTDIAYMTIY